MSSATSRPRRVLGSVLDPVAAGLVGVATVPAAYLGLLTASALGDRRSSLPKRVDPRGATRFAILVPAHDESRVIGATVAALVGQQYPQDRFTVNVVADNCSDDTASLARSLGARAFERDDPDNPGKGPALNWLAETVRLADVDAVVVVDADTRADPLMLAAFDREFRQGADVVQGDYGVLEPEANTAVALRFAALACRHRLRPLGRTRLGASCGLYGNGMAFRSELLERRRWSSHLVEDAEFQLELLLDGIAVAYSPDARLVAEMPATWDGAVSQHQRWELGRALLLRRFMPDLVRAMVTGRGPNRRRAALPRRAYADASIDLLVPPLSLLVTLHVLSIGVSVMRYAVARDRRSKQMIVTSTVASGVTVIHVLAALRLVNAPRSVWMALASAPRLVLWKLGLLIGIARRPDSVAWRRTERNADASAVAASEASAPAPGRPATVSAEAARGMR